MQFGLQLVAETRRDVEVVVIHQKPPLEGSTAKYTATRFDMCTTAGV